MEMNGNDGWNQVIKILFNTVYLFYIIQLYVIHIVYLSNCSFDVQHAELYNQIKWTCVVWQLIHPTIKLKKHDAAKQPIFKITFSILVGFPT